MGLWKINFGESRNKITRLFKFYKIIWESSPILTLLNILLRLYNSVVPFITLYIGKTIIDNLVLIHKEPSLSIQPTIYLIIIEFVVMVLGNVADKQIILNNILLADIFTIKTNIRIMEHSKQLDISFFEKVDNQNVVERTLAQATKGPTLLNSMLDQVQQVLTIIFLVIGIFTLNGWYLVFLLIPAFLSLRNENRFYEQKYSLMLGWTAEKRAINYYRSTLTSFHSLREVKVLNLYDFFIARFKMISELFFVANKKNAIKRALWSKIFVSLHSIAMYSIYLYLVIKTVKMELSIGDLTFLIGSFAATGRALQRIFEKTADINEESLNLSDFFAFFNLRGNGSASEVALQTVNTVQEIVFDNVSFRYSDTGNWVLRNVNFSVRTGEKCGLMGENGCGKTTIVKLLMRFREPTEGRILLNGIDINEYSLESYYKIIGVHYQDYCRYFLETSLNIGIGNIDEIEDLEKIKQAAVLSRADKIIVNLPNGYEQMLGNYFPKGVELSGGQWQKVALARIFMKNYQVLILDEPFSAMDFLSELSIFESIMKISENKMLFLISHKLSTLKKMDKIILLENGQTLEIGSHEELMKNRGKYYYLFNLQTQVYN
jgi:ATP-binding cassette subfamily B protein